MRVAAMRVEHRERLLESRLRIRRRVHRMHFQGSVHDFIPGADKRMWGRAHE